jgi:phosphate transport system permease protein
VTAIDETGVDRATVVPVHDPDAPAPTPRKLEGAIGTSDKVFRGIARGSGIIVLLIMTLVGVFLTYRALEALQTAGWSFFTTADWSPDAGAGHFGIAAVIVGTTLIALTAIVLAVPLATGTALYISEYAPARSKRTLISIVDLMAAVPSVVFGLWGFFLLQGHVTGLARWISTYFGWIPFFNVEGVDPTDPLATETVYTSSTFIAGLVVGLMITPLLTSVMREVFSQAPAGEREGAYALGATKWGMIRSVVLPFGKGGMIGGTMLGLGRALGETIAVYMIISPIFVIQPHILANGGSSVSSLIALRYGEATAFGTSALMAAGLALFVMTLIVNFFASSIVSRSRSGASSDA